MGSLVLFAESASQTDANESERYAAESTPTRRSVSTRIGSGKSRKAPPPHRPGLLTGSDRALE